MQKTKSRIINRLRRPLLRVTKSRSSGPRILAICPPKSGTHLLTRLLDLLPGIVHSGYHLSPHVEASAMESTLSRVRGDCYLWGHIRYTEQRSQAVQAAGYKSVLMFRDPRDQIVSLLHYVRSVVPPHHLRAPLEALPDDETRLLALIQGMPDIGLANVHDRTQMFAEWLAQGSHLIRFEQLIGVKGGGSQGSQRETIRETGRHLGVVLSPKDIEHIAQQVFNPKSKTFRKGMIGDWENHFTKQHKQIFKEIAGQQLIDLGYEQGVDW